MSSKYYPGWAEGLDIDWASDEDCGIGVFKCRQCGASLPSWRELDGTCGAACRKAWNRENHNRIQEERAREKRKKGKR